MITRAPFLKTRYGGYFHRDVPEEEVDATEVVQDPRGRERVAVVAVDVERLLRMEPGEQPLPLPLGHERRLEHCVRARSFAARFGGELERRFGVTGRRIPVAAKLVAA